MFCGGWNTSGMIGVAGGNVLMRHVASDRIILEVPNRNALERSLVLLAWYHSW